MTAKIKEQKNTHEFEAELKLTLQPGDQLREARLKQKLSIAQVSAALRISERYIVALEEHDAKVLPEQVYALGFVRAYAIFLGLSSENLIEEFKKITSETNSNVFDFPMPETTSSVPKVAIIAGSVIVIALIYAFWISSGKEDKVDILSQIDEPKAAKEINTPVIDEIIKTQPEKIAEDSASGEVDLENFYIVPGQMLTVHALRRSWIHIKDSDGRTLLRATLRKGENRAIMVGQKINLSTDNAGGITLSSGDLQTKALGARGQVLHSFEVPFKVPS